MWKKTIIIVLLIATLSCCIAKSIQDSDSLKLQPAGSYFGESRRSSAKREKTKSSATTTTTEKTTQTTTTTTTTTTKRPIIRYWNNIMRRVRMPWNMTNPLVNFFNDGTANFIETPILDYHAQETGNKRRRKTNRKRKTPSKHPYQQILNNDGEQYTTVQLPQQQLLQQQLADPQSNVIYFYDPNMRRYYALHALPLNDYYQPTSSQYYNHQNQQHHQEPFYHNTNYENYYRPVAHKQQYPKSELKFQILTQTATSAPFTPEYNDENTAEGESNEVISDADADVDADVVAATAADDDVENENAESTDNTYVPAEGVEVVEDFNDEDDDDEYRSLNKSIDQPKKKQNKVEMLRNLLGSYMNDDAWNRKRQRSHTKHSKTKPKQAPRYRYFLWRKW